MVKVYKYCFFHDDAVAVGHCRQCHKAVCGDCAVEAGDAVFCSEECVHKFAAFKERYGDGPKPRSGCLKKAVSFIVGAVILLIVLKILAGMGISIAEKLNGMIFGK